MVEVPHTFVGGCI